MAVILQMAFSNNIFFYENLQLVPKGQIDNKPALVQIMAWYWTGDKPLTERMMV